ncbi:hypothetical protein IMY05_002G0016700 [Salix suchowensis]|nr:hypothetical protein IMY05_002G0016700 [Salix suchowensis]
MGMEREGEEKSCDKSPRSIEGEVEDKVFVFLSQNLGPDVLELGRKAEGFLVWRKRLLGDDNEKSEKSDAVSFPAWAILGDQSFVGHEAIHGIRCNVFVLIDSYKVSCSVFSNIFF